MHDIDLIEYFLSYLKDKKKTSQNTLSAYERDLKNFCEFVTSLKKTFSDVATSDVDKFKQVLISGGRSVATVSRCMSSIRSFYRYLVVSGYVSENPAMNVKNDKSDKKDFEILTEKEIDLLLSCPDTGDFKGMRDKAMLELLYATGLRISELISLNVSDVNLKMNFVNVVNAKDERKNRMILLYPACVEALDVYIHKARHFFVSDPSETALFVNVNGDRITRQGFWKLLKTYVDDAGIKKTITPHTLRHSFATHLLENGADIHDIKHILGHTDISSTHVYSDFIKRKIGSSYLRYNHRSK